jgi:hypothetical protein
MRRRRNGYLLATLQCWLRMSPFPVRLSRNLDLKYKGSDVDSVNFSAYVIGRIFASSIWRHFWKQNARFLIATQPQDYLLCYLVGAKYRLVSMTSEPKAFTRRRLRQPSEHFCCMRLANFVRHKNRAVISTMVSRLLRVIDACLIRFAYRVPITEKRPASSQENRF